MIIYCATNKITTKKYIGKTTRPLNRRIGDHRYKAIVKNRQSKFCEAIREYGIESFEWEIVARATNHAQLKKLERQYMLKYDTLENGYNSQIH